MDRNRADLRETPTRFTTPGPPGGYWIYTYLNISINQSLFLLLFGLRICDQRAYVVHISMGQAGENLARGPIAVSLMRPFVVIEGQPGADPAPSLDR